MGSTRPEPVHGPADDRPVTRRAGVLVAAVLAAAATPAYADRDQTFVEAVVTVHGSGSATCAPGEPVCQGSATVDVEGRHVEVAFYERTCHAYGPDTSSGPGAGTAVVEWSGATATATFACTAVLVERIL